MTEKELYNKLEEYDKTVIKLSKEIKELKETIDKAIEDIDTEYKFLKMLNLGESKRVSDLIQAGLVEKVVE